MMAAGASPLTGATPDPLGELTVLPDPLVGLRAHLATAMFISFWHHCSDFVGTAIVGTAAVGTVAVGTTVVGIAACTHYI